MKKLFLIIAIAFTLSLNVHGIVFADPPTPIGTQANTTTDSGTYTLLAPIGKLVCISTTGQNTDPNSICAKGGIGEYFNIFLRLIIGLCAVLAVVKIIFSGIQYMGEDSVFGKTEAKGGIIAAIGGLLIALGAYALLYTVNPDLLGINGLNIPQANILLDPDTAQAIPATGTNYPNTSFTTGASWPSDADVRSALTASGITINAANCTNIGQHNCTSVYQLDTSIVTKLKNDCGCVINITGGTEFWLHNVSTKKIHYPGGWTVDLATNTALASYVQKGTATKLSWGTCYVAPDGLAIVDEGNHFHTFSTSGGCVASAQGN